MYEKTTLQPKNFSADAKKIALHDFYEINAIAAKVKSVKKKSTVSIFILEIILYDQQGILEF